jgi:tRNA(Arg) A34 adenosine deaminase TadA
MARAVKEAREGIAMGQSPFGAVVVKEGLVIASAHNQVWASTDPTAHAEVLALRVAAKALKTIDLKGCTVYTTCEPCPMCLAAIHWAHVDRVFFGASIADAAAAGFRELPVPAAELARLGGSPLEIRGGVMQPECAALFDEWRRAGLGKGY